MLKGYDDDGFRPRIVHMPLRGILMGRHKARDLRSADKRREWGKGVTGIALIRWPYTTVSANGWDPFRGRCRRVPR